jgi:hypothetical protein
MFMIVLNVQSMILRQNAVHVGLELLAMAWNRMEVCIVQDIVQEQMF